LTSYFEFSEWNNKIGRETFADCREKRCFAFRYKSNSQIPLEESDGVIVHAPNLHHFPSRNVYKRNPRQLWSFYTLESQRLSICSQNFDLTDLDDWFNLTKTVKFNFSYNAFDLKQLDRYQMYRDTFRLNNKTLKTRLQQMTQKKLAFWFVSNCATPSKREMLIEEISKYMEIDIYGKCNFKNSKHDPCKSSVDKKQCLINLYSSYKFYFSFENTNCDFYITEKYFKFYESQHIFEVDLVPIVRGAKYQQYLDRAPSKHSFIFADHFSTPKSLADYILYLDRNQTAYLEYFEWKRTLEENLHRNDQELLQPIYNLPLCDLCEKLHDDNYLNSTNNPVIKISEFYNPAIDCAYDEINQSKKGLLKMLKKNCFWADYYQHLINFIINY